MWCSRPLLSLVKEGRPFEAAFYTKDLRLVRHADFLGLHAGLGLGPGLEHVSENGELGRARRLFFHDRALLRLYVLNDVIFRGGLSRRRDDGRSADRDE
jgi:hypothetical protein